MNKEEVERLRRWEISQLPNFSSSQPPDLPTSHLPNLLISQSPNFKASFLGTLAHFRHFSSLKSVMALGLLGRKLGMTQIFSEGGEWIPVTVIEAGPCTIVQKKIMEKDGYNALQLGFIEKKLKRVNKPLIGHFKKNRVTPFYQLHECRVEDIDDFKPGQRISVQDIVKAGDSVDISGKSKGRGFAGVMKRWGFRGGPGSHGSMFNRSPGSIGASADPSRVFKGKKLPGRLGGRRVTVQNLKVIAVRPEDNIIMVKGATPGSINSVVEIKKAKKGKNRDAIS